MLIVPDVMGIWPNSALLADGFAARGYAALLIDALNGDPVPLNVPLAGPRAFDLMGWLAHGSDGENPHTPEAVDPIVEAALAFLRREKGFRKVAAVGYCFGAKVCSLSLSLLFVSLPITGVYLQGACAASSSSDGMAWLTVCAAPPIPRCSTSRATTRAASTRDTWRTHRS